MSQHSAIAQTTKIENDYIGIFLPPLRKYFESIVLIPNNSDWNTWSHTMQYDCHVDAVGKRKNKDEVSAIDFKIEEKNPFKTEDYSGNLFIESWSNRKIYRRGWFYTSKADLIDYCFIEDKISYLFQLDELRDWLICENAIKTFIEVEQNKYEQNNDTWGYLVSIDKLIENIKCKILSLT